MKNIQSIAVKTLVASGLILSPVYAFAADTKVDANQVNVERHVEKKDNGGYMETVTTSRVDDKGTGHSQTVKTDVVVDANGDVKKTVETEKTVDPKGLFNKKTETDRRVLDEETTEDSYKKSLEKESTNSQGTNVYTNKSSEVKVDADGNLDTKNHTETQKDPKGLMNKTTSESNQKVDEKNKSTVIENKKEINGDTVEDSKVEVKK